MTCPLSLQMSHLCGRTAEHNAAGMLQQRSAAAHFPRLKVSTLKQGLKGTWTMKDAQALCQHKNGLTFWIPEWKNMKPFLSVCRWLMLIVFSLFRGYHKHKSGNKYSLHRTGVLACPQPPLYPHIHKFSGTCPCLEKGRERVIEMIHCKSKLTAWQPCISWMGWMASGSGCHLPPPGFLHLFIQCYSTGDIRHKCGKMSFAVRKLGEGSPHNVLS